MSSLPIQKRPPSDHNFIRRILKTDYNFDAKRIKELESFCDRNYYARGSYNNVDNCQDDEVLLKLLNSENSKNRRLLNALTDLMLHISKDGIPITVPLANINGDYITYRRIKSEEANGEVEEDQDEYAIRLFSFLPGKDLSHVDMNPKILFEFGALLARLNQSMARFTGDVEIFKIKEDDNAWSLMNVPGVLKYLDLIDNENHRKLVKKIVSDIENLFLSRADEFDSQLIHGDMNDGNMIVKQMDGEWRPSGIIDFSIFYCPAIVDLSILLAYSMVHSNVLDPFEVPKHVVSGFTSVKSLTDREFEVIPVCLKARLIQSMVLCLVAHQNDPTNEEYFSSTARAGGWELLERMDQFDNQFLVGLCKN